MSLRLGNEGTRRDGRIFDDEQQPKGSGKFDYLSVINNPNLPPPFFSRGPFETSPTSQALGAVYIS
jgi:hypothetical protein